MSKKDVYIYGAGEKGKEILSLVNTIYSDILPTGFIDKNKQGKVDGIPILKVEGIENDKTTIIAISNFEDAVSIYWTLNKKGVRDIWWYYKKNIVKSKSLFEDQLICCENWTHGAIKHVEMHIMDACNLNCRGCAHFSPIFKKEIPDYTSRLNDVKRVNEKIGYIHEFYILGGEPLLNPDIGSYVKDIRKILVQTNISIVTNGLLILSLEDEVLKRIQSSNVNISISEYKPVHRIIELIENRLKKFQVSYSIRPLSDKEVFNRPLTISYDTKHKHKCISDGCVSIWNGKISRCPTLMYIEKFNEYFCENLPNEGIVSLEDALEGWDLIHFLKKTVPLCSHCIEDDIKWATCSQPPKMEDFSVRD